MADLIIALGGTGIRVAACMLDAAVSGVFPHGDTSVEVFLCDFDRESNAIRQVTESAGRYQRVRDGFSRGRKPDQPFSTEFRVQLWPEHVSDGMNAVELCRTVGGDAPLLAESILTKEEQTMKTGPAVSGHPVLASLLFSCLWETMEENDPLMRQLQKMINDDTDEVHHIMLVGSASGAVGSAGLQVFADRIYRLFEKNGKQVYIGCVMLLPYRQNADAANAAKLLSTGEMERVCSRIYLLGLPEAVRSQDESSMTQIEWMALQCYSDYYMHSAAENGIFTVRVNEGKFCWEDFGTLSEAYRVGLGGSIQMDLLMQTVFLPAIRQGLKAPSFLRDRRIGWYWRYFGEEARRSDEAKRQSLLERAEDMAALLHDCTAHLYQLHETLPRSMRYPADYAEGRAAATQHYEQLVRLSGQLHAMRTEAEQAGITEQKIVHRSNQGDSEAEKQMQELEQMEEQLQRLEEEQNLLNRKIGGVASFMMMRSFAVHYQEEAQRIDDDITEVSKRIEASAAIAKPEEMHLIDSARAKLERLKLRGEAMHACCRQIMQDLDKASEKESRFLPAEEFPGRSMEESGLFRIEEVKALLASPTERKQFRSWTDMLQGAWADLIIGSHPETIRGITERVNGAFDSGYSGDAEPLAKFFDALTDAVRKEDQA